MSDRYVVVASNSFSGAHFVDHLLKRGAEVLGTSRSPEAADVYLPYKWDGTPRNFTFRQLDLNHDLAAMMRAIDEFQPQYIVNFAAQSMVAQSWDQPTHWFQTNAVGQVAFHDELRKRTYLKRYVHISTPEVYGTCNGHVTEDHSFAPSTPYAVSRAAADLSLRTFVQNYNFPAITTRAANVYGPGQRLYRIIPRTLLSLRAGKKIPLHGGGVSVRSFIHIADVAEGTRLATTQGSIGDTYHLATADSISIRDLVQRMCTRVGVPFADAVDIVGERAGKDLAYLLDTTKARTELGWSAATPLDRGIEDTLAWIDRYRDTLEREPLDYIHQP